jgi:hypothetical protein
MGHLRVGRLPRRWGWEQVIAALSSSDSRDEGVVSAAAQAAKRTLSDAKHLESLAFALWTFLDLANAARSGSLIAHVSEQGGELTTPVTGLALLRAISRIVEREARAKRAPNALDDIALQTFESVALSAVREESRTLFGCTPDGVEDAFRKLSTKLQISSVGRRFFSEFTYRSLRLALERELARSLGARNKFTSSADLTRFDERLRAYCWDVSKIVEEFSGGWYSKAVWERRLNLQEVQGFTAYAIEKLLTELAPEKASV